MQTSNKILDDMAKMASGAVSAVTGLKGDGENFLRRHVEKALSDLDLVSREEFEVVKAMAAKARTEQDKLQARIADLEGQLKAAKKPSRKSPSRKKAPSSSD